MAEYIDRMAILNLLENTYCTDCDSDNGILCRSCPINDVCMHIDDFPAADVVEVIKCGNCRYYNRRWGCRKLEINVSAENYCFLAEPAVVDSEVTLPGEE